MKRYDAGPMKTVGNADGPITSLTGNSETFALIRRGVSKSAPLGTLTQTLGAWFLSHVTSWRKPSAGR